MISKITNFLTFVKRFLYYGYHGAKFTTDYDAEGVYHLIYAHIKRVSDFMHDPSMTHLEWNSNPNNKDMRLLREFEELSRRKSVDSITGYYTGLVFDEVREQGGYIFDMLQKQEYRKKFFTARKKDDMIREGLEDRYWYLLRHKVPNFWD